ncbi:MAG: medium chain dehydrogenase/reductase family protein [Myxococcota bacterium]
MRQVWITRRGGPEVLEVREAPDPEPKAGEVRIRVKAAGLNFAEVMARIGLYPDAPPFPCVVGYEVSGEVDKVGAGVTRFAPGARVIGLTRFGGHSDTLCVPEVQVTAIPDSLGWEKAAALPVNYLTAWLMLVHLGNVRSGEKVLVHAAAGGVGQAAIQVCRWKGAEVIGTASASKHARLKENGVAHCIDYTTQDFEAEVTRITGGAGVDIVLDAVGGKSFAKSYNVLAPLGRLFLFGGSAFAPGKGRNPFSLIKAFMGLPTYKPFKLMEQNKGVFGVNLGHLWEKQKELGGMMATIVEKVADGTFDPVVDQVFPFTEAGKAHDRLKDRKNFGKVVLVP